MTDEPTKQEQMDMDFLDALEEAKPERLSTEAILLACKDLIMDYAPTVREGGKWLLTLNEMVTTELRQRLATEGSGECMCDECVAKRKKNIN